MTSIEDAVEAHQKAEVHRSTRADQRDRFESQIQVKETVAREKLVSEAVKNLKCDTNTEKWRHAAEVRICELANVYAFCSPADEEEETDSQRTEGDAANNENRNGAEDTPS